MPPRSLTSILFPLTFVGKTGSSGVRGIYTYIILLLGIVDEPESEISPIIVVAVVYASLKELEFESFPNTKSL